MISYSSWYLKSIWILCFVLKFCIIYKSKEVSKLKYCKISELIILVLIEINGFLRFFIWKYDSEEGCIWKNKVTKKRIILFENLKRQISLIL